MSKSSRDELVKRAHFPRVGVDIGLVNLCYNGR